MTDIVPVERGKTELFEEALAFDKAKDFNPLALSLVDGPMRKSIAAWPFVSRQIEVPKNDKESDWSWAYVHYSPFEWMNLAGLETSEYESIITKLRTLGLIFADGTMPDEVRSFLGG